MHYSNPDGSLKSPFYRVATRAIIRDGQGRVVVVRNYNGKYELPGGGWEHTESLEECLRREVMEELGVPVSRVGDVTFVYRGPSVNWPHYMLRVAVEVEVASFAFASEDSVVASARPVDRDEFLGLEWSPEDHEILQHVGKLWPAVEKKHKNR